MKCEVSKIATLFLIVGLGAGLALAQDSQSTESLVDLARQLKAQRAKSQEKSKVYTNDDLANLPPLTNESTAPPASSSATSPTAKPGAQPSTDESGKDTGQGSAMALGGQGETHGESYFRAHLRELEDRLDLDQREVNVLQQQLGQNQMMYYPDPNKGLLQSSGPTAMSDIRDLQDKIAKKQAKIAADQEDIENLREQLRREGGDPGWLRSTNPTGQAPETVEAAPQPENPPDKIGTKEYWQDRFSAARARLADARERQKLSENELNLLQIQQIRALNPSQKSDLTDQVNAKQDDVSQKRAATEEANKALEALQKEFEASGAPEDWLQDSENGTQ